VCKKNVRALLRSAGGVAKGRFITNSARRETTGPVVVRKRKKKNLTLSPSTRRRRRPRLSLVRSAFFLPGCGLASSLKAKKKTFREREREKKKKTSLSLSLSLLSFLEL